MTHVCSLSTLEMELKAGLRHMVRVYFKNPKPSQIWYRPGISDTKVGTRQEDDKLTVCLNYRVGSRPAWTARKTCLKTKRGSGLGAGLLPRIPQ